MDDVGEATVVRSVYIEMTSFGRAAARRIATGVTSLQLSEGALIVAGATYGAATIIMALVNIFALGLDEAIADGTSVFWLQVTYGNPGLVMCMFNLIVAGVVVAGALAIRHRQAYRLTVAAAVLAALPLMLPYGIVTIPLGAYALYALTRRGVRAKF